MDISLAKSHMQQPCEVVPHGADNFNWARQPAVVMGCNPTAAGLPSWYSGTRHAEWPRIMVWFTVYREAGAALPRNTRVAVRNLQLWIKSKATGQWAQIDAQPIPHGGAHYAENMSGVTQPWGTRLEGGGSVSLKPPKDFCAHGWGAMQTIVTSDIAGVYASIEHKVIADNSYDTELRLVDRWGVNIGVDYYPPEGAVIDSLPGCFTGRYLRSLPDWRESSGIAL